MATDLEKEEVALRRRLLFRLLRRFDFDAPVFSPGEAISSPLPSPLSLFTADEFIFRWPETAQPAPAVAR